MRGIVYNEIKQPCFHYLLTAIHHHNTTSKYYQHACIALSLVQYLDYSNGAVGIGAVPGIRVGMRSVHTVHCRSPCVEIYEWNPLCMLPSPRRKISPLCCDFICSFYYNSRSGRFPRRLLGSDWLSCGSFPRQACDYNQRNLPSTQYNTLEHTAHAHNKAIHGNCMHWHSV
jgi:hypothetical protein